MGVATLLGLFLQRWMTYELLQVDGGLATWCLAVVILVGLGVSTAVIIGVPCFRLVGRFGFVGNVRSIVAATVSSIITTIAHGALAPFATTALDHAVIPGLCLAFYGVFYASYYRDVGGDPTEPFPHATVSSDCSSRCR